MVITLNTDVLNGIDLSDFNQYQHNSRKHLHDGAGKEPYKLYAFLSLQFDGIEIVDIGSRLGNSALALSYNDKNHVFSYDINHAYYRQCNDVIKRENITFDTKNMLDGEVTRELIRYPLIHIDVDPHCGGKERHLLSVLENQYYQGIVLMDDIGNGWDGMIKLWNEIDLPKYDLTKYGHASGTGLVDFSGQLILNLE